MNQIVVFQFVIIFGILPSIQLHGQTMFKVATSEGYAEGTTGGVNDTVIVTTPSAFISAVSSSSSTMVIVSGSLNVGAVNVGSNKTIIGADTSSTLIGNLLLNGVSNIIIQNINIQNKLGVGSGDGIEANNGSSEIYVNKCTFIDCADGAFDIKNGSNNITFSWCRFKYPTQKDHCFPNLIGHDDNNGYIDKGKLKVTVHHNWYDIGCQQRMPRVRFGEVHVYNNYYGFMPTNPGSDYAIGVGVECSILVENCYFDNIDITWWEWTYSGIQGSIEWRDLCLVKTKVASWADNADLFDPPYEYILENECNIKDILTDDMYGAGNMQTDTNRIINNMVKIQNENHLTIYPVPAKQHFSIKNFAGIAEIFLYDMRGSLIMTKEILESEPVYLEYLPANVYIIKVVTRARTEILKLVIQ